MSGGFTMIPDAWLEDDELSINDRIVLIAVRSFDWAELGDGCIAAISTIAKRAALGETATKAAIAKLVRLGRISREERREGNVRLPNRLRVTETAKRGGSSHAPPQSHGDGLPSPHDARQDIRRPIPPSQHDHKADESLSRRTEVAAARPAPEKVAYLEEARDRREAVQQLRLHGFTPTDAEKYARDYEPSRIASNARLMLACVAEGQQIVRVPWLKAAIRDDYAADRARIKRGASREWAPVRDDTANACGESTEGYNSELCERCSEPRRRCICATVFPEGVDAEALLT
jgi:hypothetical protein